MNFVSLCKYILVISTFVINLKLCQGINRFDLKGVVNLDNDNTKDEKHNRYQWNPYDPRTFAFLRICGEFGNYEVQPVSYCSKGIIFKEPFIPNCICPFGVWILKTSLCDDTTFILVGDSRKTLCYSVGFQIRSILYLGDPENIRAPRAYVASKSMTVFHEIPQNGAYTPKLALDKPVIIAIFPNGAIETDEGSCFPLKEYNKFDAPVHIWSSDLEPARYRIVEKCSDEFNFSYDELAGPYVVYIRSNRVPNYTVPHARCENHLKCTKGSSTTIRPFNPIHSSTYPPGGLPTSATTKRSRQNYKTKAELEAELLVNPIEVLIPGEESNNATEYEYEVVEISENAAIQQGILNPDGSVNIAIVNESISDNPNENWSFIVKFIKMTTAPPQPMESHPAGNGSNNAEKKFKAELPQEAHLEKQNLTNVSPLGYKNSNSVNETLKQDQNNIKDPEKYSEEKEVYKPAEFFTANVTASDAKPVNPVPYPTFTQYTSNTLVVKNNEEEALNYPVEDYVDKVDNKSKSITTTTQKHENKIPPTAAGNNTFQENTTPSNDQENTTPSNTQKNTTPSNAQENTTPSNAQKNTTTSNAQENTTPSNTQKNTTTLNAQENTTPSNVQENTSKSNTVIKEITGKETKVTADVDDSIKKRQDPKNCNGQSTNLSECPNIEEEFVSSVETVDSESDEATTSTDNLQIEITLPSATEKVYLPNVSQLIPSNSTPNNSDTSDKKPARDLNVFPLGRNTMVKYKPVSGNSDYSSHETVCIINKTRIQPPKCKNEDKSTNLRLKFDDTENADYLNTLLKSANDYRNQNNSFVHKYFVKTASIFTRACPTQYLRNSSLSKLMNVFLAFIENSDNEDIYTDLENSISKEIHETNLKVLDECFTESLPFSFRFDTQCPLKVACGTFMKHSKGNKRKVELEPSIPSSVAFNPNSLDITIETAWKLSLFLKYYCGKYFVENVKINDLASLNSLLEHVFLNVHVVSKWYKPLRILQPSLSKIFGIENIDDFVLLFDSCLGFSKKFITNLEFEETIPTTWKQWTPRPNYRKRRKRSSKRTIPVVWGNLAYCINSYWDPLSLFPMSKMEASCYKRPARLDN